MEAAKLVGDTTVNDGATCVCAKVRDLPGNICAGCRAREEGRNCWEVNVSPCCDLPRDSCETCHVFAAAMRHLSLTERIRVTLEGGVVIEGDVHRRKEQRISDTFNDPAKSHIPVTNAVIKHPPGSGMAPERRDVILVAKRACFLIYPVKEQGTV